MHFAESGKTVPAWRLAPEEMTDYLSLALTSAPLSISSFTLSIKTSPFWEFEPHVAISTV